MNLITGATGHIGNVLARELLACGQKVRALVLPGEDLHPLQGLDVETVPGNVLDLNQLVHAFHGVDTVYHLAGVISIMPGPDALVQRVNVEGTCNVLAAARQAGIRRLVYTSSIHAIRRVEEGILVDESIPYDPQHAISAYDRSKAEASLAVLAAARSGLDAVLACPTGVIGPHDYRLSEMGRLILMSMRSRLQFWVQGAYDFVDVRDVAHGLRLAAECGRAGESYILSGQRITIPSLVAYVRRLANRRGLHLGLPLPMARWVASLAPAYYRFTRSRPLFTSYALATVLSNSNISHAKASAELGYTARPVRQTLADAVAWFQRAPAMKMKR